MESGRQTVWASESVKELLTKKEKRMPLNLEFDAIENYLLIDSLNWISIMVLSEERKTHGVIEYGKADGENGRWLDELGVRTGFFLFSLVAKQPMNGL